MKSEVQNGGPFKYSHCGTIPIKLLLQNGVFRVIGTWWIFFHDPLDVDHGYDAWL